MTTGFIDNTLNLDDTLSDENEVFLTVETQKHFKKEGNIVRDFVLNMEDNTTD